MSPLHLWQFGPREDSPEQVLELVREYSGPPDHGVVALLVLHAVVHELVDDGVVVLEGLPAGEELGVLVQLDPGRVLVGLDGRGLALGVLVLLTLPENLGSPVDPTAWTEMLYFVLIIIFAQSGLVGRVWT